MQTSKVSFFHRDRYGNNARRSLFETHLAKAILENEPTTVFQIINAAIINCIDMNPSLYQSMLEGYGAVKWDLLEDNFIEQDTTNINALNYFLMGLKAEPINILNCVSLYRIFFERHFQPQFASVAYTKSSQWALGGLCQQSLQQHTSFENQTLFERTKQTLMPPAQFADEARGRLELGQEKSTRDFGITDEKHMPFWAKNWHQRTIHPAKDIYRRDPSAIGVQFYNKNDIPFIAGPSGTIGHCLLGVLFLLKLSASQLKQFVNLFAAGEIALGHHSYYDIMQVANNLKLFHHIEKSKNDSGLNVRPHIDPQHLYTACLTDEFKATSAYQALTTEYPELLGVKLDQPFSKPKLV